MSYKDLGRLEKDIDNQQRNVSYDTKEYTIELIVNKYLDRLDLDDNEFFVPDYQREFVWDDIRQSRFIESLMIGLPIPYIFLAETVSGRYEIVDGSQRIRTLAAFVNNDLKIKGLEKIPSLNELRFSDLDPARQRKFRNISMKIIALSDRTTEETKTDIFERINRGSDLLKDMEYRKGIYKGAFNNFITKLGQNKLFIELTPMAKLFAKRQEREELLLRFFAFSEWYPKFSDEKGIARLLDDYMMQKNEEFKDGANENRLKKMEDDFNKMIKFVKMHFPDGFAKNAKANQVARPYFEAISVGSLLALREKSKILISETKIVDLITNKDFHNSISGRYKTHKSSNIKRRIDYIKNGLLNG